MKLISKTSIHRRCARHLLFFMFLSARSSPSYFFHQKQKLKDWKLIIGEDLGISCPWNINKNDLKCNMSGKVCFSNFDYPICPLRDLHI